MKASHKLAEVMYQQSAKNGGAKGPEAQAKGAQDAGADKENVVDADYKVEDEDKK